MQPGAILVGETHAPETTFRFNSKVKQILAVAVSVALVTVVALRVLPQRASEHSSTNLHFMLNGYYMTTPRGMLFGERFSNDLDFCTLRGNDMCTGYVTGLSVVKRSCKNGLRATECKCFGVKGYTVPAETSYQYFEHTGTCACIFKDLGQMSRWGMTLKCR